MILNSQTQKLKGTCWQELLYSHLMGQPIIYNISLDTRLFLAS